MPDATADTQREMLSLLTARVRDAYLHAPIYLDGATDLRSACRTLAAESRTGALVRDGERLGIFTTTDLRDAMARDELPASVREVARFDVVEVGPDADLFEALWLMLRHRVHRLLVRDGKTVLGVLGQSDLVGFVANHSHIVALQIDTAQTIAELAAAAQRIDAMVALLHDGGIKIERIARLVTELNRRLLARAWAQIAPPELVAHSCLVVMGSEGRGEQILKTDQDNALILRDGFTIDGLDAVAQRFTAAMSDFGWPPCPGGIMLSNPAWRRDVAGFRATLRDWVHGSDTDGPMNLAIFADAAAVAGDPTLLADLHDHVGRIVSASDAFLARFAAAADQFEEPATWWSRLVGSADELPLDLKKLGTFPIVHGARALVLAHGIRATDTVQRIERLVQVRALDADLGRDLTEALHYLMGLKLRHRLAGDNLVRPQDLSTMDRDQLKDALAIVKRFRSLLRQRFRLDAL